MKNVTYIDKLTKKQEMAMKSYVEKWIEIGLRTGETDWATFDKYMPICYKKANLKYPSRIVRVQSPLIGALAASVAEAILRKQRDAVGGAVGDAVGGAVDDAVRGAVRGAVGDAVRDAVDDAVGDAVQTAISIAKRSGVTLVWHYWLGGQFWVGWGWSYWGIAFVNFFFDICKLKLAKDIMERAEAYRKVSESVNYIWPNRDFVMVCARPIKISRNSQGRLHSDTNKAIEYPDGWGLYVLNGVRFPEDLWKRIVSKQMPFDEILAIKNIDQRTQAMKYGDIRKFLEHTKSSLLDIYENWNTKYELWKTPKTAGIFQIDAYHLIYKDPTTGLEYASGIEPKIGETGSSAKSLAWKRGLEEKDLLNAVYA